MPSIDSCAPSPSLSSSRPFSISLSSKPKSNNVNPSSKSLPKFSAPLSASRKRPHSALVDPESDPEDLTTTNSCHEAVVGFADDGAVISVSDIKNKKQPLVIKAEKNRDWREEKRQKRGKNLLPAEVQAQQKQQNGQGDATGIVERSEVSMEGGLKTVRPREVHDDAEVTLNDSETNGKDKDEEKPITADEEAIAALMGGEKKKSTLTILSTEDMVSEANGQERDPDIYINEADRFRADVDSRPAPASLADYAAVPVEEFGAAILRGLGWKEGEAVGGNGQKLAGPREVKRRPALLGIGAKETPGGVAAEELGAWNQKKGRGKQKVAYNPVMLKNSVTGEMITEEEMELRKAEAKQGKTKAVKEVDWREGRETNLKIDDEKRREKLAIEDGDERAREGPSGRQRDRDRHRDRNDQRDRKGERNHISSRRETTERMENGRHGSASWDRSQSSERKSWRKSDNRYDDRSRQDADRKSGAREEAREYERRDRHRDYDSRDRERVHKRH